jgi:hypothetical protein
MQRWDYADIEDEPWRRMKSKGRDKMMLRKITVEHPFGTIERWTNQGYLLRKGLEKVMGESGFSVIAHNMKNAISINGTRVLVQSPSKREKVFLPLKLQIHEFHYHRIGEWIYQ